MEKHQLEKFYQLVGKKITVARKRRGKDITQEDLAKGIGISRTSVVNIEKGRQRPSLHLLWNIGQFLEVDVINLIPTKRELTPAETQSKLVELINNNPNISLEEKERLISLTNQL